ncbi:MAG: cellulase family glycosylhydrolase [Ruegeria sp.]
MRFIRAVILTLPICFGLSICNGIFAAAPALASEDWPLGKITLNTVVPDLSGLNHVPAGVLGTVEVRGSELVFQDGSPARFWGANLQAYAIYFTEPDHIQAHAKRLAQLGFNLVRIHHHDSDWVQPNVFGDQSKSTTQLNPDWMSKLDQWVAALKAEGIYIWLDLHVGRRFTAADGVDYFNEIADGAASIDGRGYNYVSDSIERLMREFQSAYLAHENPLTGLSYAQDPAVIAVQLTNENDLTHHFGNRLLPDKDVPAHSAQYMDLAAEFANEHGLDPDVVWRSWEQGLPKVFLTELEKRFNERMREAVRATGFSGLISTTSLWGGMSVAGLPSQTLGSIADAHSYGWEGEVRFDPRERPGFLDWIAIAQIADMPFSVTEWNLDVFLAEDRFLAPLRIAATAAHQGWDALMVYGYSQQPLNDPVVPENWSIAGDPAMIWMMPAAALLYRQGHVRPAARTFALCPDSDVFFGQVFSPETSVGIRTIVEQSRLVTCMPETPELPWLIPTDPGALMAEPLDLNRSYLTQNAEVVTSDTAEFFRDFGRGLFVVNTATSQIAAGNLQDGPVATTDVTFDVATPMAAVAVQSLDDKPLARSGRVLISISARATPLGPSETDYRIEPVSGQIRVRALPDLRLTPVDPSFGALADAHHVQDGYHLIDLDKLKGNRWLILE